MHVVCSQTALLRGLTAVNCAISRKAPLPILAQVLLSADQGRLKLCATNLEIGITAWVDTEGSEA